MPDPNFVPGPLTEAYAQIARENAGAGMGGGNPRPRGHLGGGGPAHRATVQAPPPQPVVQGEEERQMRSLGVQQGPQSAGAQPPAPSPMPADASPPPVAVPPPNTRYPVPAPPPQPAGFHYIDLLSQTVSTTDGRQFEIGEHDLQELYKFCVALMRNHLANELALTAQALGVSLPGMSPTSEQPSQTPGEETDGVEPTDTSDEDVPEVPNVKTSHEVPARPR